MQLTCEQCQTSYRLDDALLGKRGRMVRCNQCKHMWFQEPAPDKSPVILSTPEPVEVPEVESLDEGAGDVENTSGWLQEDELDGDIDFRPTEKGQFFVEEDVRLSPDMEPIPQSVKPLPQSFQIPVMTHQPMGMGAAQFGIFVYLFLCFATASALFVAKRPLVQAFPEMSPLYAMAGMEVRPYGDGLRLSELTAESRIEKGVRQLALEAKLSNISARGIAYPSLRIEAKGAQGEVLKAWSYVPEEERVIEAEETVPLKMTFQSAPEEAKTVVLRVTAE